ncbi:preprotein translocase subunit SecA [bacterium DOLZORAL124_38_8]|nr:MAG: preprotein translocase subunit SecA [bacterium DOLZORAL124_38_8]
MGVIFSNTNMVKKFIEQFLGNYNEKEIKKIRKIIPKINALEEEFQTLSDEEMKAKFLSWKEELTADPSRIEDYLIRVFAGVKNAARRLSGQAFEVKGKTETWNMVHYDVQLIGGIVLHQGKIAEMKTGEGKTLVCTAPVILNALTGKGVHVITVNDYLASRDAEWMKPLYEFCGLSVGVIVHGVEAADRQAAYQADITYGTNNEFGFDYLRDNMAQNKADLVQRALHFAIVDEVDSILIDEARTPLIISSPAEESTDKYVQYSLLVPQLQENDHYNVDEKTKVVTLNEEGVAKMESLLGLSNLYTEAGFEEVHHIEQALKAHVIFERDRDYVVQDDQVVIVDEFTGRLMPGRRFSDGLHQALEAKERVEIQRESKTLATITFQNYFRLYEKLSGMTGTAETEAEEFAKIYALDTLVIPTNKPIARQDLTDKIFKNEKGKFLALAQDVREIHQTGQPVLIGTSSIEKSEALSTLLHSEGIKHEVLNAKQHEREAEIVSRAGEKGAVTIATNMAGRGTDIKLTDEVLELGGLAVLGTERHESRRIDNQLRGRSGRQGDAGFTQFYVSMRDELMRRFGGDRMSGLMESMGLNDTDAIENKMISKSVENAQKKIESFHFDARKHVVQYDDVMNVHREKMYDRRRRILFSETPEEELIRVFTNFAQNLAEAHIPGETVDATANLDEIFETLRSIIPAFPDNGRAELENLSARVDIAQFIETQLLKAWEVKKEFFPAEQRDEIIRFVLLKSFDDLWLEHINSMTSLKDRVALSGYAQKDPIVEYRREAFSMFKHLLFEIRSTATNNIFRIEMVETPTVSAAPEMHTNENQIAENLSGSTDVPNLTRAERRRLEKARNKQ